MLGPLSRTFRAGIVLALLCLSASVHADPIPAHTSVGTPQNGRIAGGGVALPLSGPGFVWITNRDNERANYGTPTFVAALARAASEVARVHPGSVLAIHDIAFENGGRIRGHGSHTSGRDADIAYYAVDPNGAAINPTEAIWFRPDGRADNASSARFDAQRVGLYLTTLLSDRSIRVQYVFMEPGLSRLLSTHVRRTSRRTAQQLGRVLRTAHGRNVDPHADHMHVRILCPPRDVRYGCTG